MGRDFSTQAFARDRKAERSEHVDVWVDAVRVRTDKAALCLIDGREVWVPLSAAEDGSIEPGAVSLATWLVRKESLPEHDGEDRLPDPSRPLSIPREPGIGTVSKAFGRGTLLRVEGDKSVVRFADGKVRTLANRYLERA